MDNSAINIVNLYCPPPPPPPPPDKDLSLQHIHVPSQNCLAVGDFNSHSLSWGYGETDHRGDEVEDWQIENNMLLLNDPEDPPTFFSHCGSQRLLQTWPLQLKTCPEKPTGRSWASWQAAITDQYYWQSTCSTGPATQRPFPDGITRRPTGRCSLALQMSTARQLRLTTSISTKPLTVLTSPSWEQPLRQSPVTFGRTTGVLDWRATGLEDEMARTREKVENNPTPQNNIAHKACNAKYRKAYIQAARTSWREKTEKLNLDRDGNKLWKLTKAMNDEDTKSSPVMIQRDQETVTGKSAANCFIDSYEQVSNIMYQTTGNSKYMMKLRTTKLIKIHRTTWTAHSTQRSLKRPWKPWRTRSPLAQTKSLMRCGNTLAPKQSQHSWESSTTAGRQGMFLRTGEKLTWYPSTRRARTEQIQTATVLSASPVVRANSWKEWSTLAWCGTWRRTTSSLQSRQAFSSTIPLRTRWRTLPRRSRMASRINSILWQCG